MTETFLVLFQTVPPRPSWVAYRAKSRGTLSVAADHARFVPRRGEPVTIEHVFRVGKGWKASMFATPMMPALDTYIEVLYGNRASPQVAYINDGRWFGLRTYLPHRKLLNALRSLMPVDQQ